jgi:hypothetical protein
LTPVQSIFLQVQHYARLIENADVAGTAFKIRASANSESDPETGRGRNCSGNEWFCRNSGQSQQRPAQFNVDSIEEYRINISRLVFATEVIVVVAETRPSTRDLFEKSTANRSVQKHSNYFEIYDRYLEKFRGKRPTVIEIGVQHGGSLLMWEGFFDGDVDIVGLDILPDCRKFASDNVRIFIGDQSDQAFLDQVVAAVGKADIIIDDGSHIPRHQIKTFEVLFHTLLADGGVYICEDCHTSYWPGYGGGLRKAGTFIEFAKRLCDDQNAWFSQSRKLAVNAATRSVRSVSFYTSVVVFEKAVMTRPQHVEAGGTKLDLESPFKAGRLAGLVLIAKRSAVIQRLVRTNPALWRLMKRFIR